MADERFQDFPQKTNPSGSDELVGVDGSGYFRSPISSLPSGGEGLPEFFKFMVGDKVLIVQTGQSNPQGLEARRAAAGVDTWENNRVWDWQWSDRTTVQQDYTNFADSRWGWVNPATTQTVAQNFSAALMYMGYIGGNTGNQAYALANQVQLSTGLDVYVVNLCQGGASIEWWETPTVFGINMAEVLQDALQYILAGSTGIDFQSKPGPDIVSWGQSEANMPAPMGTYPTTPDDWAQRLDTIFNLARSQTESWVAEGYSKIFLTEATDYVNWDGTPIAGGSYAGVPYQWDGANVAGTIYGDDIVLVSSRGIEHGNGVDTSMVTAAPVAQAGNPTYLVHYSGDGNDAYGRRIADIVLGRAREFKDTDLDVENGNMNDRVTALEEGGGSSLNAVQKDYGIAGEHFQQTSHFTNSEIAFSTNADDTLFGIEPILCNVSGSSTVARSNQAPLEVGVADITANGSLSRAGVQASMYPTTLAHNVTKITLSTRCSPYTAQTSGDRHYFRVGWQRPFTDANDDQGVFLEYRFGEANWRAVAIGQSGPTADDDTGVPVTIFSFPFGTPNGMIDMVLEIDLVANTAKFTINGVLTNTIDVTNMDFTNLASLGVLVKKTENTPDAVGLVDFLAIDVHMDYGVSGLI